MDGRGYGSGGFSGWGGGGGGGSSSRGSGGYDLYGYKDSMSGGYGGGQMKRGLSGSLLSSSGGNADDVIAKINQRLDMLTQLEGGMKGGGRNDRFDQYESFDSRSSALGPRDLYRSGNLVFGDSRGDMMAQRGGMGFGAMGGAGGGGGGFGSSASHGNAKMRHARDAFSGSGWGAGQRSQHRGGGPGGRGFGRRQDSSMMGGGGGQGHSPSGRGKLPSLLSHRMYPESGGFQPHHASQDYPVRHFGGGKNFNRQRTRKRPLNRPVKPQRDGQKKRKQTPTTADEPESKMGKTESDGEEKAENAKAADLKEEKSDDTTPAESESAVEGPSTEPAGKGESSQSTPKQQQQQQGRQTPPSASKLRKRRGFFESRAISRVTFACSVCKFRSFYSEDLTAHLESKFHKDHFRFLSSQLSKPTTEFLQEYINDKHKKTDQRIGQLENHSATICQVLREQDLTRDIGMEHFMKKVEAAYCSACDLYIPMQFLLIQKHLKSPEHNYNRKGMMEQSKRSSLSVARSILNHKVIGKKLESYLKGENPFTDAPDDQDPEDSMMEVSEGDPELKQEVKQEANQDEAELEDVVGEPDAIGNGDGPEEETKMEEEEGEKENEAEGGGEEEEEEEDVGVEVKEEEEEEEEEEPKGTKEPDTAADAEDVQEGAEDDGGIPVIDD
ncbi:A-kinase anchor protein 8-like isoform 3-T3 [Clarias gariepinus]|uniref:A-kinase anchor protein 8-like isoform X3 n=1 Tax=Clarias gariepinus TaxID=13013 RepID=UPI00234D63CF|nr:A-kinase anchor protein 8-like isoform X3 [Clarias gariepinus]